MADNLMNKIMGALKKTGSNIHEKMTDDKGLFQGGRGGRTFGRLKDATQHTLPGALTTGTSDKASDDLHAHSLTRELDQYQKGKKYSMGMDMVGLGKFAQGDLEDKDYGQFLNMALSNELGGTGGQNKNFYNIHSGGETRALNLQDIGMSQEELLDPKNWEKIMGQLHAYDDQGWSTSRFQKYLQQHDPENYSKNWNTVAAPIIHNQKLAKEEEHAHKMRYATLNHPDKFGDYDHYSDNPEAVTKRLGYDMGDMGAEILSGGDDFDIGDIVNRTGVIPEGSIYGTDYSDIAKEGFETTVEGEGMGTYDELGDYSEENMRNRLRRAKLEPRIEDVGY